MKKTAIVLTALLLSFGCMNAEAKKPAVNAAAVQVEKPQLFNEDFYIDVGDNAVKLLFKTAPDAKVSIFMGETKETMKKVKEEITPGINGVLIDGLIGGKEYVYSIEAENSAGKVTGKTVSFKKMDRVNNWAPAKWAKDAVFYEVFVRSFYDGNGDGIGDFKGLTAKISYLKELGVDALWLMPMMDTPSYHGYDVRDYYKVEPDFGTNEDFQEFMKAAHANGIRVVIDYVINHSSSQHPWFIEALKGKDNPYRDYYTWATPYDNLKKMGTVGGKQWHTRNGTDYYNAVFWDGMPDLNMRNPKVREEVKKGAKFWLDPNGDGNYDDGVDGFRLDASMHVDTDMDVTHNFWKEFNTYVKSVNPNAFLVGENWANSGIVAQFYKDLDSSFNFDFALDILRASRGNGTDMVARIAGILEAYKRQSDKEIIDSTFITNHDQNRVGSEVLGDKAKMKLAGSILLTMPGTPFIYYGEELGQMGRKPDDNIREPFDWYASAVGTGMTTMKKGGFYNGSQFTKADDGISYEEEKADAESVFNHYKRLIEIRKGNKEFNSINNYEVITAPEGTYGYKIKCKDYNIFVVYNTTRNNLNVKISGDGVEMLTNAPAASGTTFELTPFKTIIIKSAADKIL